jgi:hypothetical protein
MAILNKNTEKLILSDLLKYATGYDLDAVNDKISKINNVLKDKPINKKNKKQTYYEDAEFEEIK